MAWDLYEGKNRVHPEQMDMTLGQMVADNEWIKGVACACAGTDRWQPKWQFCYCHGIAVHKATMQHLAHILAHQLADLIKQRTDHLTPPADPVP
jgi:hypothetical protein